MKKYELLLTLPGTLDENETKEHIKDISELIKETVAIKPQATESGLAEVAEPALEVKDLGKMRLAYPVKQIRYGYFYNIIFKAPTPQLQSLREKLRLRKDLLRAIVTLYNIKASGSKGMVFVGNQMRPASAAASMASVSVDGVSGIGASGASSASAAGGASSNEETKKTELADIDKKLDEILDGNIVAGV